MAYPVSFDIQVPQTFDRGQIVLRIVILLIISWFFSWLFGAVYWVLPIIAAILVSQRGAEEYLAAADSGPTRWLKYIMGIYTYFSLASDKLPFDNPDEVVQLRVEASGTPTLGSALLRIILGIPHLLVLGLLGIAFFFVWLFAAISILISEAYPAWAADFIRGYLRWIARLMAYMASLVDEYPPFEFDTGAEGTASAQPASLPPGAPPPAPPAEPQG